MGLALDLGFFDKNKHVVVLVFVLPLCDEWKGQAEHGLWAEC